jgi:XTP/dITP diphosphohydrolase
MDWNSLRERKELLLGTTNKKKLIEMNAHLEPRGFELLSLSQLPTQIDVEETGETFLENARLKAVAQACTHRMWTIGEDSGLCVPALNGDPGIFSARYSERLELAITPPQTNGAQVNPSQAAKSNADSDADSVDRSVAGTPAANSQSRSGNSPTRVSPEASLQELSIDQRNNKKLLRMMAAIPAEKRQAYYVSAIVLCDPQGNVAIESTGECWGKILFEPRGQQGFGYDPLFEVIEYHSTFAELGLGVKRAISHRSRALREFLSILDSKMGLSNGQVTGLASMDSSGSRPV